MSKILRGLEDALAYAKGDKSRGRETRIMTEQAYVDAVKGRRTFRQMYRDQKAKTDRYGLALMMIREGCADPQKVAADALREADHD